jgi:hypothetical protein
LKHYETVIKKNSENVPGSAKSMIKVSQSTKRGFSKKSPDGIIFVLGLYESLKHLEG